MSNRVKLEICCGDLSSVCHAKKGGAQRIELCCGLSEGGITPSIGMIDAAVKAGIPEINVLIRPRQGDFLYTNDEINLMENDIISAVKAGATGIVTGVLTSAGNVDKEIMKRLISAAKNIREDINITFHRAFDVSRDYQQSLKDIIMLGCDTLLTSGMARDAFGGMEIIRNLVKESEGRITVMAGGGINPDNLKAIIDYTGVSAIHSTARKWLESKMTFRRNDVSMSINEKDESGFLSTDASIVSNLLQIIEK